MLLNVTTINTLQHTHDIIIDKTSWYSDTINSRFIAIVQ